MTAKKRNRYAYKSVHSPGSSCRNKKGRKSLKIFFCLVFCGGIMYGLYFGVNELLNIAYISDKIIIKDIDIFDAKNVTKAEIKELLPFKIGDNLLKVNLSRTEDEIKRLKPELKNICINRRWQKVRIKLYERTPEAFIMQNGELSGIDFDDKPFPLRGFMSEMKVPRIIYKTDNERIQILDFIKKFKSICGTFLDNILEIKLNNTGDIIFITTDNTSIVWGEEMPEHLANKFKKFQEIYEDAISKYNKIEYINMALYSLGRAIVKPAETLLQ
ncbi:MAG: cell division protein FtsQ/DivIB [Endomicrobium sp.]|jgi:cell division protein FtsQ|nr:cell division protein FtsQ/DivIB [Endomicrobium sp.]